MGPEPERTTHFGRTFIQWVSSHLYLPNALANPFVSKFRRLDGGVFGMRESCSLFLSVNIRKPSARSTASVQQNLSVAPVSELCDLCVTPFLLRPAANQST